MFDWLGTAQGRAEVSKTDMEQAMLQARAALDALAAARMAAVETDQLEEGSALDRKILALAREFEAWRQAYNDSWFVTKYKEFERAKDFQARAQALDKELAALTGKPYVEVAPKKDPYGVKAATSWGWLGLLALVGVGVGAYIMVKR